MKQQTQALSAKAEALVPTALKDFYTDGVGEALSDIANNHLLKPDLSRLANNAQKQAFVKGYTTALRIHNIMIMEVVDNLEAVWHYDEENIQEQQVEK